MWANNYEDPKTHEKFYKTVKDGKTMYAKRFRDKNDGTGKQKWTPLFPSTSKVKAYIRETKEKNLLFAKENRTNEKHKFIDVFNECFEHMREEYMTEEKSPQTVGKFKSNIMKYVINEPTVNDLIGKAYIEDLVINDVKEAKRYINKTYSYLSKGTISCVFHNIDRVFLFARDYGFVTNTFCTEIVISSKGKKQKSKKAVRNFLSEKEFQIFLDTFDQHMPEMRERNFKKAPKKTKEEYNKSVVVEFYIKMYRAFFMTCFYTGCRRNEMRGLRWSDIINPTDDFPLFKINVDTQFSETYAGLFGLEAYTSKPKTDDSIRIITMFDELVEELGMFSNFLRVNNLFDKNQFIFFDFFGRNPKPIPKSSLDRTFQEVKGYTNIEENSIVMNGIKRNITLHGMRHSACTMLLERGMPKEDVAKFLGHKDTKMVDYVYSHFVDPKDMEEEKKQRNIQFFHKNGYSKVAQNSLNLTV
ncbi:MULTISPECIES: site-specific integrase [Erysipelotrichaceae]|uniref:site-specific integrase n=1 Tax=Erysipelotrichaceae TaxID=128827 RepID=UPI000E4A7381|nr:site-specific integrase [Absiella sp. AM27-20]RHU03242.1 site-specific integrase [Absiella sp. AM27-20]